MMVQKSNIKKVALFLIFILLFQVSAGIAPIFAEGDSTPPIINNLESSPSNVVIGGEVEVKADVTDDVSGVKSVAVYFHSPSKGSISYAPLYYNETSGLYEGALTVAEFAEEGEWTLYFVAVTDQAGNGKNYLANEISNEVSYQVVNEQGDKEPPIIKSIGVSEGELGAGDTLKVTAEVTDDVSGVKSVAVYFHSPSKSSISYAPLYYNEISGLYEGALTVAQFAEEGEWTLYFVAVTDQAGNGKNYSANEISNEVSYQVVNEQGDKEPPIIKSIDVSEGELGAGDTLKVTADVTDDVSGVKSVAVYFHSPSKSSISYAPLYYNEISGLYEGALTVAQFAEEGEWTLYFVAVTDQAGNGENYSANELTQVSKNNSYVVVYKPSDLDSPELNDSQLLYAIMTKNEFLSNRTIDKDLYIGPNSTVFIEDNVTITGNVYVYGTLISYGGLTIQGSLNAKTVTYGSNNSVSPGAVRFVSGQNSISSIIVSNQPYEVPFKIDNENLTNDTGTIEITGKTLPFLDVSIQGNPVPLEMDGSFATIVEGITSEGIQFNLRDVFGNDIKKEVAVKDVLPPANVSGFTVLNKTHNAIQMSWNTGAEIDLKEYGLYLNGELVTTVPAAPTEYTFENLNEGTLYELGIAAIDISDNKSEMVASTATTLLSKPIVNPVSDQSTSVTGQAFPGTKVSIQIGESVIGTGNTDATGEFKIEIPAQKAGTELNISVSNEAGILSKKAIVIVEDKTAPALPTVNSVSDKDLIVSGTAEAKSVIIIKAGETVIAEGIANEFGKFSIAIDIQQAGTHLAVTAKDTAGNVSAAKQLTVLDATAPIMPIVSDVTDKSTVVTGIAEAASKISVKTGSSELATTSVAKDGKFSITIVKQKAGTKLTVTAKDAAGNISEPRVITVLDATAPTVPKVDAVTDKSTAVTGSGEVNALITIKAGTANLGSAAVEVNGTYSVTIPKQKAGTKLSITATDQAGNVSVAKEVIVMDDTAPAIPVIDKVTHKSTEITGTAEANGEVSVMKDSALIASGKASVDGNFRIPIVPQPEGTKLEVYITDQAGNRSGNAILVVEKAQPEEAIRISGATRYDTAIAISKEGWTTADTVVLATAGNFPDALAGGPLAFKENAPILLTRPGNLMPQTKTEIERLGAKKVIILGSQGAVSLEVEEELKGMGLATERIGGKNRFETAALIADRLDSTEAILASGLNFPDVLSVSAYAAKNGVPILLTRSDKLPVETEAALKSAVKTHVIGSTGAVGEAVFNQLPNPIRYGGKTRYETGFEVNSKLKMGNGQAYIATGANFPDALAGSVLAAKNNAPILLVKAEVIPEATEKQLINYESYAIFGGTGAVDETVRELLKQ